VADTQGLPAHLKAHLQALDRSPRPLELGLRGPARDERAALAAAGSMGLDYVVLDLWARGLDPEVDDISLREPALPVQVWNSRVVGRGAQPSSATVALGWARHTGLAAVILPLADDDRAAAVQLGRSLAARPTPGPAVWVQVPWTPAGFKIWRVVSALVGHHPEVSVCLETTRRAPAAALLESWRREVPACVAIRSEPTTKAVQDALTYLFGGRTKRAYLDGAEAQAAGEAVQGCFKAAWAGVAPADLMAVDHGDPLMDPVQPLRDHIGAAIYQHFEQVGPKYEAYERAMVRALQARRAEAPVRVAVLGAGRGPLVDVVLRAAGSTGVQVDLTAVEKNPHAASTLRQRAAAEWGGRVQVQEADMRTLAETARFDLTVSELLGGFGDNELSPECLQGMQRWLRPGGASLPASSTSYLAPAQAEFLWSGAQRSAGGLDVPVGVHLDRASLLSDYQRCFHFTHPEAEADDDLQRQVTLSFVAKAEGLVHGFIGTFDAAIDADEVFGNHPDVQVNVASGWAPLFFPLRVPVRVKKQEKVTMAMWRVRDAGRVWYAWALLDPVPGAVQNANGQAASLAL